MSATTKRGVVSSDIRRMLSLVSEVSRHPGSDTARALHALRGAMTLTRSKVGVIAQVSRSPGRPACVHAFLDIGWSTPDERAAALTGAEKHAYVDPMLEAAFSQSSQTTTRRDVFSDSAWYAAPHVAEIRKPARIDECVYSIVPLREIGHYACLALHRGWGDPAPYSERDRQITDYLWQSLSFLHELPLPTPHANPIQSLPQSLRPTFELLRSPNRLATAHRKLGLSAADFRKKTREVFTHFKVSNRLELLVKLSELST